MANPHPTKSKPTKIGRKHTTAKSVRAQGKQRSRQLVERKAQDAHHRKFKSSVAAYWRGELTEYPTK